MRKIDDAAPAISIGWLHGHCLALADPDARIGSRVEVVAFGDVQKVVAARLTGKTVDEVGCAPLLDDRRAANLRDGQTFYRIDTDIPVELGIGIVRENAGRVLTPTESLDTNGDGRRDTFSHCTTSEGVRFSVWADEAWSGTPLWTGYYYLGYDTEADCPLEK